MILTVVVPTYNRAEFLGQALASIPPVAADHEVEVLVIDDGSTDNTSEILKEFAESGRRIRYIRQENSGVAIARNTGLANLAPETGFLTFLDSDDVSPAGALDAQLSALLADPALDLVYGRLVMTDDIDPETNEPTETARRLNMVGIQLSCALFRRELVDRIGMFDEEFVQAEDTDFLLRVFESGARFRQTDTVCLFYRRHPNVLTENLDEVRRYFVRAIHKSMARRRLDPSIRLVKPDFEVQQIGTAEF